MVVGSRLRILDPVAEPILEGASLAPRLDTLDGKVIGLYSNNKLNATRLLDMVEGLLRERYALAGTVRGTYNSARLMRRDEWKEIEGCDAIILSNGDWGSCSSSGLLNSIELEKLGIPAALIGTDAFIDACRAMAKLGGIPEMRWALVAHPLGSLPEAELMVQARSASEQFVDIVTGR